MTGNSLKTYFEFLVDDSIEDGRFLDIIQIAARRLWTQRPWEFLKTSVDTTSATVGTTTYSLPSDFLLPLPIWAGDVQIYPIARDQRRLFRNSFNRYYLDIKNSNFIFTQSPTKEDIIYFDYIYNPTNLALDDVDIETTIPGFLGAFHPLLAYEAAKTFFYQDTGAKSDSWASEHQAEYNNLYRQMVDYDHALKTSAQNSAIPDIYYPSNNSNVIDE